jgi:GntR family transcriptional regulator
VRGRPELGTVQHKMVREMIDKGIAVPPYRQLAAILRARIERGTYPPGGKLPSVKYLSQDFKLAELTVRKTIDLLKQENLVITVNGMGTYVRDDVVTKKPRRR